MARPNYGAIREGRQVPSNEVFFGDSRNHQPNQGRAEFNQLVDAIASNIFTIQTGGSNLERAMKLLGTKRDTQSLRDNIHVIQMSTNQVINQTSQDMAQLVVFARSDRIFLLQVERLKNEFEKSLQRYSTLQKDVAKKMKQVLPLHNWEYEDASSSQDRQALLERAAEERHQKLQTLKQVEFEREMLVERDERIRQIESDVIDVNQIMKELSAIVQEQGENLNSIENNIDQTYTHVEEGRQQLEKASSYQRTHCKWLCFLAILGVTMAGVVALILYIELRPS